MIDHVPGPGIYRLRNGYRAVLRPYRPQNDDEIAFDGTISRPDGYMFRGEWMKNGVNVSGSSIAERRDLGVLEPWEKPLVG